MGPQTWSFFSAVQIWMNIMNQQQFTRDQKNTQTQAAHQNPKKKMCPKCQMPLDVMTPASQSLEVQQDEAKGLRQLTVTVREGEAGVEDHLWDMGERHRKPFYWAAEVTNMWKHVAKSYQFMLIWESKVWEGQLEQQKRCKIEVKIGETHQPLWPLAGTDTTRLDPSEKSV